MKRSMYASMSICFVLTMAPGAEPVDSFAAQHNTNDSGNYTWLDIGLGVAANFTVGASVSFQFGRHLISVRANTQRGILNPPEIDEFGILYGRSFKDRILLRSIAAGVSLVNVSWADDLSSEGSTIGIPLEVQLFVTPLSYAGLGVYCLGNINSKISYAGVLLCLQLGRLR